MDFTPDKVGRFEFQCSVTCGSGHDDMMGEVVVVEPSQQKVDVSFDDQAPGVAIVVVNGNKSRERENELPDAFRILFVLPNI